jgi:hypothetical protein
MPTEALASAPDEIVDNGTAGLNIALPPPVSETQTVSKVLTERIGCLRRQARVLNQEIDEHHQRSHFKEWRDRTSRRGLSSPVDMLDELAELGFAWRDIARAVGVTVQAIQKWRRGARMTGENRHRLAGLLAACDLVAEDYEVHEVASWFEMPMLEAVPVTPIDLWATRRPDLVFEYASGHAGAEQILTTWDPEWREHYRSDFEVFRAGDGQLSIRPKDH